MEEQEDRSSSWPLFRQSAEDLAVKLNEVKNAEAAGMAKEASTLASTFQSWEVNRPTNEVRVTAIKQLFDLNRRANDYLSKLGRPPAGKSAGPPSSNRPITGRR